MTTTMSTLTVLEIASRRLSSTAFFPSATNISAAKVTYLLLVNYELSKSIILFKGNIMAEIRGKNIE